MMTDKSSYITIVMVIQYRSESLSTIKRLGSLKVYNTHTNVPVVCTYIAAFCVPSIIILHASFLAVILIANLVLF